MSQISLVQAARDTGPDIPWVPLLLGAGVLLGMALYLLLARGQASTELRAGLALGLRGLLAKELRTRSRGWRPLWLLTGYLSALALGVTGLLALMSRVGGTISPTIGTQLFSALAVGTVLMLAFITPALTVGTLSGERERRTLDLLLVTRASPLGLVSGKLMGSLFYILFLLAASLPAFALVYLFGGVPPLYFAMVVAVAAVTAIANAALGLLLSALLRRTLVATVVAYLLVLFLSLGLPFLSAVATVTQQARAQGGIPTVATPPIYLYASPMASLASVLPGSPNWGMPLVGDLLRFALSGGASGVVAQPATTSLARSAYVVGINPTSGLAETAVGWAPWVYHFLLSGVFTLLCLLVSALTLAPAKPWRRLRR